MRIRNKPWALDYLVDQSVVELNPQSLKGKWKDKLQKDCLCVEIGSGKGDFWIGMSDHHPDEGWVALEKDKNVSVIAVKKVEHSENNNRIWVLSDADNLDDYFSVQEIDRLYLNFSDPWPKRRYHKRRLTHYRFLETYDRILIDSGCIIMKTDNQLLFDYSLQQFSLAHWVLCELSLDYKNPQNEEDVYTEYERKFTELGNRIYRAVWKKGVK